MATEVYSSESQARHPGEVVRHIVQGFARGRNVAYSIFQRELRGEYAKSRLGLFWDFAEPLVLAVVFMFLRKGAIINFENQDMPYALFVIFGMLLWRTFTDSLTLPLNIFHRSRAMITQTRVPPEALTLSVLYRVLFNASFRLVTLLGFALVMQTYSIIGFVKFLALVPAIVVVGMSFGILLAPINTIYNDVGRFIGIVLVPLMYISPVMFIIPADSGFAILQQANPITYLITPLRSLATLNEFPYCIHFWSTLGVSTAVGMFGCYVFHLAIPILGDKV